MIKVINKFSIFFTFLTCLFSSLVYAPAASAMGIDFLGDLAEPIIGPAKDKMKSALVYVWLQPYAGYGFGSSEQSRTASTGVVTKLSDIKGDGFLYGGRGGLLLIGSLKVGLDYSIQSLKRKTLGENLNGTYYEQSIGEKNTMMGALVGFDVPYTPLQGFVTRYFKATLDGDAASAGDGWGGGISFVLKSPFILSLETRKLNYSGDTQPAGKKAEGSVNQYYATLSFMLF